MFNHDNIWYFPGNVDVRSCPKNASASLKQFWIEYIGTHFPEMDIKNKFLESAENKFKGSTSSYRWQQVLQNCDFFDMPFRRNSIRFAIKRDPLERFKSAVEMLQTEVIAKKRQGIPRTSHLYPDDKVYRYYDSVKKLLDDLEDNKLFDAHFLPQTYFLGNKDTYSYIYDTKDFEIFQKHVLTINDIEWNSRRWYIHKNISNNTPKEDFERISEFTTKARYIRTTPLYGKLKVVITKRMTDVDIKRIMKIYEEDYDNGWC
jgi:hypothetical protein